MSDDNSYWAGYGNPYMPHKPGSAVWSGARDRAAQDAQSKATYTASPSATSSGGAPYTGSMDADTGRHTVKVLLAMFVGAPAIIVAGCFAFQLLGSLFGMLADIPKLMEFEAAYSKLDRRPSLAMANAINQDRIDLSVHQEPQSRYGKYGWQVIPHDGSTTVAYLDFPVSWDGTVKPVKIPSPEQSPFAAEMQDRTCSEFRFRVTMETYHATPKAGTEIYCLNAQQWEPIKGSYRVLKPKEF